MRARQRADIINEIPFHEREAVRRGIVLKGMNQDAVYIAFGYPSRIAKSGEDEFWVYDNLEATEILHRRIGGRLEEPGLLLIRRDDPFYVREPERLEILFKNDKVVDWQT